MGAVLFGCVCVHFQAPQRDVNSTLHRPFREKLRSSPPPICRLDWGRDPVSQPELGCLDGRLPSLIHSGCARATRSRRRRQSGPNLEGGDGLQTAASAIWHPGVSFRARARGGGGGERAQRALRPLPPVHSREIRVCAPRQPAPIDTTTGWLLTFRICTYSLPIYQAQWQDPTSRTPRLGRINAPNFGFVTSFCAPKWGGPPQRNAVKMEMSPPHFGAGYRRA